MVAGQALGKTPHQVGSAFATGVHQCGDHYRQQKLHHQEAQAADLRHEPLGQVASIGRELAQQALQPGGEKYNTCTGTGNNYVNTNKTKYLEFSAWAGISNGVATLVGNNRITTFMATPPQSITFDPSLNSVIGLSLKIKPQFLPRFVFLNVDAMYFKHNFKTAEKFSDIENYNLNIGFSYLSFTPSLGIILNGKIKPYIKLGGHFTALSNIKSKLEQETIIANITYKTQRDPYQTIRTPLTGIVASVGAQIKRFSIEARYEKTTFKPLNQGLLLKTNDLKLLLGYRFY